MAPPLYFDRRSRAALYLLRVRVFVQDDWRVSPRLTVNLGLRYELNTVPKELNDLQGNFDPNSPTRVAQVGFGVNLCL